MDMQPSIEAVAAFPLHYQRAELLIGAAAVVAGAVYKDLSANQRQNQLSAVPLADKEQAAIVAEASMKHEQRNRRHYYAAAAMLAFGLMQLSGPRAVSPARPQEVVVSLDASDSMNANGSDNQPLVNDAANGAFEAVLKSPDSLQFVVLRGTATDAGSVAANAKNKTNVTSLTNSIDNLINPLNSASEQASSSPIADTVTSAINNASSRADIIIETTDPLSPVDSATLASELAMYRARATKNHQAHSVAVSAIIFGSGAKSTEAQASYDGVLGGSNVRSANSLAQAKRDTSRLITASTVKGESHPINWPIKAAGACALYLAVAAGGRRIRGYGRDNKSDGKLMQHKELINERA